MAKWKRKKIICIKQTDMTIQACDILEMISQSTGENIIEIVSESKLSYESCEFLLTQLEMAGLILKQDNFYKRTNKRID
ncbi:hypothetical protein NOM07_14570 [Proteus terrae]|uniref:hypothetical protein n=1 Tax=Proteus terrae TaxID=1574161 RepID=UPI00217E0E38|nr:hypothetical protein [Proteus terrae]MCS6715208.1 hypothetical protein [Proteus terrae]MCS6733593.1 hypothetical protein [Proteus terrae]